MRKRKSSSGLSTTEITTVWRSIPVVDQIRGLLCGAVSRQMNTRRRDAFGGHDPVIAKVCRELKTYPVLHGDEWRHRFNCC